MRSRLKGWLIAGYPFRIFNTNGGNIIPFRQTLLDRLVEMGIEFSLITGFIRLLLNCIHLAPEMNLWQVNKHLQHLGWDDFELDYHTFELAKACLEEEGFDRLKYIPPTLPSRFMIPSLN